MLATTFMRMSTRADSCSASGCRNAINDSSLTTKRFWKSVIDDSQSTAVSAASSRVLGESATTCASNQPSL